MLLLSLFYEKKIEEDIEISRNVIEVIDTLKKEFINFVFYCSF